MIAPTGDSTEFVMNLFEAGVVPGIPAGAIVGGMMCKSYGALATAGCSVGGLIGGGLVGWLYAFAVMGLMSIFGVLWLAVLRRPAAPPTEKDIATMSCTARPGIFLAVLAAAGFYVTAGWVHALVLLLVSAPLLSLVAVVSWQMQQTRRLS